jgi:hypothetical protein
MNKKHNNFLPFGPRGIFLQISWFLGIRRESGFVTALEKIMKKYSGEVAVGAFNTAAKPLSTIYGVQKKIRRDVVNTAVKNFHCRQCKLDISVDIPMNTPSVDFLIK